jgi:hypothetical protein
MAETHQNVKGAAGKIAEHRGERTDRHDFFYKSLGGKELSGPPVRCKYMKLHENIRNVGSLNKPG